MNYKKYTNKLLSLLVIMFMFGSEAGIVYMGIPKVAAADPVIPVYDPLEIQEFTQTDWSGGAGLNTATPTTVGNRFKVAEGDVNLDTSGGSLKLKAGSTTDYTYPTYNPIHQVDTRGHAWGMYKYTMFDGTTTRDTPVQGAPINSVVGRFPTNLYNGASLQDNNYFYVEPGVKQTTGAAHGLYYSMFVTLKKPATVSQVKLFLGDSNRIYTGYMIKGSNDQMMM